LQFQSVKDQVKEQVNGIKVEDTHININIKVNNKSIDVDERNNKIIQGDENGVDFISPFTETVRQNNNKIDAQKDNNNKDNFSGTN